VFFIFVLQQYYKMATIAYKIFEHHFKEDGTVNIKFRITHKRKQVYYPSPYFVSKKQLKKDLSIKDTAILDNIYADIIRFREKLNKIGARADSMTPHELMDYVINSTHAGSLEEIDFVTESDFIINDINVTKTKYGFTAAVNNLKAFIKKDYLPIKDFNAGLLRGLESFMVKQDFKKNTLNAYMSYLKSIFNTIKKKYNTEFQTVITHSPFDFYDIPKAAPVRKKGQDMSIDQLKEFRDQELIGTKKLFRDVFFLSFYMCGMNAKDIFLHDWKIKNGRISYERSKTKNKRKDNAYISVMVPDEAKAVLKDLLPKMKQYKSMSSFTTCLFVGAKDLDITFYHARHIFATLAHNKFGHSVGNIEMALNNGGSRIGNVYIDSDWSLVDRIQSDVISLLRD
jgi:hypothetical protein